MKPCLNITALSYSWTTWRQNNRCFIQSQMGLNTSVWANANTGKIDDGEMRTKIITKMITTMTTTPLDRHKGRREGKGVWWPRRGRRGRSQKGRSLPRRHRRCSRTRPCSTLPPWDLKVNWRPSAPSHPLSSAEIFQDLYLEYNILGNWSIKSSIFWKASICCSWGISMYWYEN